MPLQNVHTTWPEVGCDEAGRGCLAGPVFGAAVILPGDYQNNHLNDSKKLNKKQRDKLREEIEKEALDWAVSMVEPEVIDTINILQASILSMHRALDQINHHFVQILVDGNRFKPYHKIPHTCIIKGDGKFLNIAAASILAKTHRDDYMTTLHEKFSEYHWNQNMGYPTSTHRDAIRKYGISPFHRKSFRLLADASQLKLFT